MSSGGIDLHQPNSENLSLTVLGSGTCELRREASSPSYLVSAGNTHLVMDLGQGALRRLMQAGVAPAELGGVLLSHHHPDHIADLLPLLFAANYDPAMKTRARITLAAHQGIAEVLSGLHASFGHWLTPNPPTISPHWLEPGNVFSLGPISVACTPARHMETSLAYRLQAGPSSLVYLGDSEPTGELVSFCTGAGLLLVNCAAGDTRPKPGHLAPAEAGELAAAAQAGGLLMSHLYSDVDPAAALASAGRCFAGPIWRATDLMRLATDSSGVWSLDGPDKKSTS